MSLASPPLPLLGALHPRVEVRPQVEIAYSQGDIAGGLMAKARKPFDPWQQGSADLMMSVRHDHKWACFEYCELCSRQNGKGGVLEGRSLAGFLALGEPLIMWSAHEVKTAMEAFRRVRRLLFTLGHRVNDNLVVITDEEIAPEEIQIKINNSHGDEGFERLDNEQRIKFIARSKSSGRGFSGDTVIIDETFAYTDEMHDALFPTMNAMANGQIIYTSSPPLKPEEDKVLFSLRRRAEAGGDDSLGYRDWGAEGSLSKLDRIDLDDQRLHAATNPAYGGRVTAQTILRNRRSLTTVGFAREIIGIWPDLPQGGGAIDLKRWKTDLLDVASKRSGDCAVAVDISPQRDYAAVALYGRRSDGLGHLQLLDYRPGTEWIVPRLVELRSLDPIAFAMGRAVFASLKAELEKAGFALPEKADKPTRGDLAVTSAVEMTASTGQMLDAVKQGTFRHTGQPELDDSVAGAKTKQAGDSLVWVRKDADADTSPLVAASLARWGFESRAHLVNDDYDVLDSVLGPDDDEDGEDAGIDDDLA